MENTDLQTIGSRTFTWSIYDEKNSVIYFFTLSPMKDDFLLGTNYTAADMLRDVMKTAKPAGYGAFLMGGSVSLLAGGNGIYLQFGGGTAIGPQVAPNGLFKSPIWRGARRPGPSFSIRASDGPVSEGYGYQLDMGLYSRNWDSQGNVTNEYGTVGLPTFSQQPTYTVRVYNGGCLN